MTALEALAARLRFDLQSAGFVLVPPGHEDDSDGGLLVSVFEDHVHVSRGTHDRLSEAALDKQEGGRKGEEVVCRYETTRATMHLAPGSILNAFDYRAKPYALGFGHIITPDQP
ncbi:hypothetical protein [Streptomyces canus]|uniref:hypothetical protein n=1 Tax=Streptomyces canus TaxID=58343 RepID=UPI0027835169|nr:hypothetical protein [Streptomyces canus]MDQ0757456.1 hypothetical protein [Streptomyces canus]